MTFFLDRHNDTLLIDVKKLYKEDAKSATLTLSLQNELTDELASWLESKLLVNSENMNVIRDVENGTVIGWTIQSFKVEASNEDNTILFFFKMLEPWKESLTFTVSLEIDGERVKDSTLILRKVTPSYKWYESEQSIPLDTKLASFALAKTNPKLTGNIKIVVTENGNMYLDTIKVSQILNNNNYRHQEVDYTGNYPHDVMRVFSSLPLGEIYKLPDGALNPRKNSVDYSDQYETVYEYGAETNNDFLYTENMKIFAPLYLNSVVPDFFCIFRVDEHFNASTYMGTFDDNETYKSLLEDGELVKCYDLRKWTAIGKYLNNYSITLNDIVSPVSLQFVEQDRDPDDVSSKYKTGTNVWTGIAIDRGIITSKQETSYFANKILIDSTATQERYDMFLTNGFERNNLIYPNILNLEFMFNDPGSETYSMHKYFGLYLKENIIWSYNAVTKRNSKGKSVIEKYDSSWNIVDDSSVISSLLDSDSWKDRMWFEVDNRQATRIKEIGDYNNSLQKNVINRPDKNVINARGEKIKTLTDAKSFVTMCFSKPIHYGEHFRICVKDHFTWSDKNKHSYIYEIVASNDERLANSEGYVFPYVQINKRSNLPKKELIFRSTDEYVDEILEDSSIYHHTDLIADPPAIEKMTDYNFMNPISDVARGVVEGEEDLVNDNNTLKITKALYDTDNDLYGNKNNAIGQDDEWPTIYRLAFYTQDLEDHSKQASLEDQLKRVAACIKKFNSDFYVSDITEDTIAIVSNFEETYLQHITNDILDASLSWTDEDHLVADFSADCGSDTVSYFMKDLTYSLHPLCYSTSYYSDDIKIFAPYGFEILGWRLTSIVKFIEVEDLMYQFDWTFKDQYEVLLGKTSDRFLTANYFKIEEYEAYANITLLDDLQESGLVELKSQDINIIMSPLDVEKGMISMPSALDDTIHMKLYTPLAHNFSLMGMFNFKDIDTRINYSEEVVVSNDASIQYKSGTMILFDGSRGSLSTNTIYTLISGTFEEVNILPGISFYIDDNQIFHNGNSSTSLKSLQLTATSNITLKVLSSDDTAVAFSYSTPEIKAMNCYVDPNDIYESDLQIPITVPVCPQWESLGIYYDNNQILDVENLFNANYQKTISADEGIFIKIKNQKLSSWYFNANLDDTIDASNGEISIKDAILNGYKIRDLLGESNIKSSTNVYYNKYTETLECIFYGIKILFSFTDNKYINTIRLNEYNNFEIFFINDYDESLNNEMFVSVKEKIILFINHNFTTKSSNQNETIIGAEESSFKIVSQYAWYENPYYIDFEHAFGNNKTLLAQIIKQSSKNISFDSDSTIIEVDYINADEWPDETLLKSNYIAWVNNLNISIIEEKVYINYFIDSKNTIMNSTDACEVSDNYFNLYNESGYISKSSYSLTPPATDYEVEDGEILKLWKNSFTKSFDLYIINSNNITTEHINEEYLPIIIETSIPPYIKFNPGYFDIRMYDLVKYEACEDSSLIQATSSNFILSNTNFSSIDKLKNQWNMKTFVSSDISTNINYFMLNSRSLVSSNWDFQYYRQYSDDNTYTYINGYIPGVEDRSMYGSKCIVLNDDFIDIENWNYPTYITISYSDSNYNVNSTNSTVVTIKMNLTQILYKYFMESCPALISNWGNLFTINNDVYIKNYIKMSLLKYFDITEKKNFSLYMRSYSQTNKELDLRLEIPEDFNENWSLVDNYDALYENVNDEIILTVSLLDFTNKAYYPIYKITR